MFNYAAAGRVVTVFCFRDPDTVFAWVQASNADGDEVNADQLPLPFQQRENRRGRITKFATRPETLHNCGFYLFSFVSNARTHPPANQSTPSSALNQSYLNVILLNRDLAPSTTSVTIITIATIGCEMDATRFSNTKASQILFMTSARNC